jgi:hypothetical protein
VVFGYAPSITKGKFLAAGGRDLMTLAAILPFAALERELGRELSHRQFDRYFASQAWEFVRENPAPFFRLTLRKALLFWGPTEEYSQQVSG